MSLLSDIIIVVQSNWGWFVVLCFLAYQLYFPEQISETKLQQIVNRYDNKFNAIDEKQVTLTQVVRAMARVLNDDTASMDITQVDEYLVRNGVEVDDFIEADAETDQLNQEDT